VTIDEIKARSDAFREALDGERFFNGYAPSAIRELLDTNALLLGIVEAAIPILHAPRHFRIQFAGKTECSLCREKWPCRTESVCTTLRDKGLVP